MVCKAVAQVCWMSRLKVGIKCRAKATYMLAITPCIHLPIKYFFIDKSVSEIMLKTWSNTEIPPNPSKNADKMTFWDIFFILTVAIKFTPFVSSNIPQSKGSISFVSKPKVLKKGKSSRPICSNICRLLKIETKTENITTYPPIRRIVDTAFCMLWPRTFPRFFRESASNFDDVFIFLFDM